MAYLPNVIKMATVSERQKLSFETPTIPSTMKTMFKARRIMRMALAVVTAVSSTSLDFSLPSFDDVSIGFSSMVANPAGIATIRLIRQMANMAISMYLRVTNAHDLAVPSISSES